MGRLIALDLPGGEPFVRALTRAWDEGDAVLPIDRRLPPAARDELLRTARPHVVHDESGRHVLDAGAPPVEDGDALAIATSGTTGAPKVIVHTRDGLDAHARAVHRHLGVDDSDRWLAVLPLAHIGGLGVVVRSVLTGTPVTVLDGFDADRVAEAPRRLGSTLVSLVPTALDRIDPEPYRWVVLGGSADPVTRPPNVVRTYGSTETGGGIVYGDRALDGVELRVDSAGRLAVRGPMLARGIRRPDGTVTPIVDSEGWFDTGDLGALEPGPDGTPRLTVHGRSDDLIISGGQNVWPEAVERVIRTIGGVTDVAVFGEPDPEWGERVVAAIVPDGPGPTLETVRSRVRAELPAYAAPRELRVVGSLPRTALGKVRRRALRRTDGSDPLRTGS